MFIILKLFLFFSFLLVNLYLRERIIASEDFFNCIPAWQTKAHKGADQGVQGRLKAMRLIKILIPKLSQHLKSQLSCWSNYWIHFSFLGKPFPLHCIPSSSASFFTRVPVNLKKKQILRLQISVKWKIKASEFWRWKNKEIKSRYLDKQTKWNHDQE